MNSHDRLKAIEHDHWLAGHETTGGMRRDYYGSKGYEAISFLLDALEALDAIQKQERVRGRRLRR